MSGMLPAGFEALAPFVETWAVAPAQARAERRLLSSEAERVAFFNAAKDLAPPALAHLDRKPLKELDDAERRLMNLMLSFAHVSLAVEVQRDHEPMHAAAAKHIRITRAPSDL